MKPTIIILSLFLFSCQTQENKDKELIESFIKEIVLKKEFSFSDTQRYIRYGKRILENEESKEMIVGAISTYFDFATEYHSKELNKSDINYKIISYKEAKKDSEININYHKRYLRYKSYSRVYHLIIDKEIRTSFIIEDDKIISFCYYMTKTRDQPREPWLLNGDHDHLWD